MKSNRMPTEKAKNWETSCGEEEVERKELRAKAKFLYPILIRRTAKSMYKAYPSMVADVSRRFTWHDKTQYWLLLLVTRLITWHLWLGCLFVTRALDSRLLTRYSLLDSCHFLRPVRALKTRSLRLNSRHS